MHPGASENGELVNKSLRIRKDQEDWLRAHSISFTDLVRRLLDDYIARDAPRRESAHKETAPADPAAVSAT